MKQVKISIVFLETGEIKEFGGFYTLKQVYNLLKYYEKDERFEIMAVEFSHGSSGIFDHMPNNGNR